MFRGNADARDKETGGEIEQSNEREKEGSDNTLARLRAGITM